MLSLEWKSGESRLRRIKFRIAGSIPVLATIVPWCNWITWPASNGLLRVQILLELQTT